MFLLVGAGGHGRTIADMIEVGAYVDPADAAWLDAPRYDNDVAAAERTDLNLALGIGCGSVEGCRKRHMIGEAYTDCGFRAPPLTHPAAIVSPAAKVGDGSQVLPGAIVQPYAVVGRFCLINSGAIIDHDCDVGDGTHVATGAILGGGVKIGRDCMIGMGAIILPYTQVPDGTLVKSHTRHPR